jgi:hypothetical protein
MERVGIRKREEKERKVGGEGKFKINRFLRVL